MLRLFCILTVWDYSVTLLCLEGWSKCFTWCVSVKLLCGLEASQGTVEEVLSSAASANTDALDSSDDLDPEEGENETKVARKKKNKRRKGFVFFFSSEHIDNILGLQPPHQGVDCDVWMLSPQKVWRAVMGRSIPWTFG